HEHLGEEAHQYELHADGEHDYGDAEERIAYERLAAELSEQRPEEGDRGDGERAEAEHAEDVDGLRVVRGHELYRHQVEHHLEGARQPVLRLAHRARVVSDGNLRDARADPGGVDGYEAVHLSVELHLFEELVAVSLERAAVVV